MKTITPKRGGPEALRAVLQDQLSILSASATWRRSRVKCQRRPRLRSRDEHARAWICCDRAGEQIAGRLQLSMRFTTVVSFGSPLPLPLPKVAAVVSSPVQQVVLSGDTAHAALSTSLSFDEIGTMLQSIAHPRPLDAFDLYRTPAWAARCEAVSKLKVELREGEVLQLKMLAKPSGTGDVGETSRKSGSRNP